MPALQEPRRERLRGVLAEHGLDAALVTSLVNVRYLTGFTGSNAALLVTQDSAVLATDGRYITQSAQQSGDLERVIDRQCAQALLARASGRVGFEAHIVTRGRARHPGRARPGRRRPHRPGRRGRAAAPGQGRDRDRAPA